MVLLSSIGEVRKEDFSVSQRVYYRTGNPSLDNEAGFTSVIPSYRSSLELSIKKKATSITLHLHCHLFRCSLHFFPFSCVMTRMKCGTVENSACVFGEAELYPPLSPPSPHTGE